MSGKYVRLNNSVVSLEAVKVAYLVEVIGTDFHDLLIEYRDGAKYMLTLLTKEKAEEFLKNIETALTN